MISKCCRAAVFALAVAVYTASSGCGPASEAASIWQGTRATIGEIEVVRNPATSVFGGRADAQLLWRGPTPDDTRRFGEWEQPGSVVAADTRIYVLDRLADRVYAINSLDGKVEASLGRRGGGPGEFERPFGLAARAGTILVGNGGRRAIEQFGHDGTYEGTISIGQIGFDLLSLPSGELYVNALAGTEGGWSQVGNDGSLTKLILPAPAAFPLADCSRLGGGDGILVRTSCTQPWLQIVGTDGLTVREITIDRPAVAPDPALLEVHLSNVRNRVSQMAQIGAMPAQVVETQVQRERERLSVMPIIRGGQADRANGLITIWEQLPDDLGEGSATLHILAVSGEYLAAIEFQESWVAYALAGGRVYALVRDSDTGLVELAAYRLNVPAV